MTAAPLEEPPEDAAADQASLEQPPAAAVIHEVHVEQNYGMTAGVVHGGMHLTINKILREALAFHELNAAYVARCRETFVRPAFRSVGGASTADWAEATVALARDRLIVVVGERGSGRHTAAVCLAGSVPDVTPREIPFDPAEQLTTANLPDETRSGYLLDLPDDDALVQQGFGRALLAYAEMLRRRDSVLVVTVTPQVWRAVGEGAGAVTVELGRPDPLAVLISHLRAGPAADWAEAWSRQPSIRAVLADAWPAHVVRLVGLVERTQATFPHGGVDDERVRLVLGAYRNWESDLLDWFAAHPDVGERIFLVAAAALEGASPGFVLQAADTLADLLDSGRPSLLDGHGARHLVRAAAAELVTAEESAGVEYVRFAKPDYAMSVLEFVFSDRSPRLKTPFWRWFSGLPLDAARRDQADIAGLVGAVTMELARRQQASGPVSFLAQRWAERAELRPVAIEYLMLAALSPELGRDTRRRLYDWVTRPTGTPPAVLRLVADVCSTQLVEVYPDIAFTRLRHLARNPDETVRGAVINALVRIWDQSGRRRGRLLGELLRWFEPDSHPARRKTAGWAVLALAGLDPTRPTALLDEVLHAPASLRRADIAAVLASALDDRGLTDASATVVTRWLADTADRPDSALVAIELLVEAAAAEPAKTQRIVTLRRIAGADPSGGQHDGASQLATRLRAVDPLFAPVPRGRFSSSPSPNGAIR